MRSDENGNATTRQDERGAFWLLLLRVASETRRAADRAFASSGSSCDQVQALVTLADRRLSVSDLARELGLERNSASQLVERLVQRGLTSRDRSDVDRRQVILELTPLGRQTLDEALDALASLAALSDEIPVPELVSVESALASLNSRVAALNERVAALGDRSERLGA
jgi:DNA-binding MarR family transcriptional regulator